MTAESPLLVENSGAVRLFTLNRPQRMNALDQGLVNALHAAMEDAQNDPAVRVIVFAGQGGNFCTGADVKRDKSLETGRDILDTLQDVYMSMRHGAKPCLAMAQGYVYGAGLSLALACDFVYAETGAKFAAPFIRIGLVPDIGLVSTLPERIGMALARSMLIGGAVFDTERAAATGLIDVSCEPGKGMDSCMAMAQKLAEQAPLAVAATRKLLHGREEISRASLDDEARQQRAMRKTADYAEGLAALLSKRAAVFTGR